jgi:indolepyruvate ferredoxin oxidoreductase
MEVPSRPVSVDDKYELREGVAFMTGVQSLVRIPIEQAWRDRDAGIRTGTLISGYPGSPISAYDLLLERAKKKYLERLNIHHVPAVNEEIAAATVHGAHMSEIYGGKNVDAITGIWYGKNPGLMRSIDVIKTANYGGLPKNGAILAVVGDDPAGKSSAMPNGSEYDFQSCGIPVLFPATPDEVLTLGLHGIAMSRFTGLWVGLKVVTNIADGGASVRVGPDQPRIVVPEIEGFNRVHSFGIGPPFHLAGEQHLFEHRLPAAVTYAQANRLNMITQSGAEDRIGIVAAGKTYTDLRQSLEDMGLGTPELEQAGIRLLKMGMLYPCDSELIREFAHGLQSIIVVEEKRDLLQAGIERALYSLARRPELIGNLGPDGEILFLGVGELDADAVTQRLGPFLLERDVGFGVRRRLEEIAAIGARSYVPASPRIPAYCSGCPHNRSTVRIRGELVAGGNGCHGMAQAASQEKRQTVNCHVMGIDGATWIGASYFTDNDHLVQNTGDGTFFHSSQLAVRAAVAAGVNITYKLLYNRAVAMTGGQPMTGGLEIPQIVEQMAAEGVRKINIVSENYAQWKKVEFPPNTKLFDRDAYEQAYAELLDEPGVTMLIFDQQCAAERRRERKRGLQPVLEKFVVVNEQVCEGCGDCGDVSSCMSVEPVETEFGRKTRIHQSSCNQDYSCLKGDCPSFLTVYSKAGPRKPEQLSIDLPEVPEPVPAELNEGRYRVYMVGIGGTGVVTANQVLAYAAMLDGFEVASLDQSGMAQKGGAVLSSVVLSSPGVEDASNKVGLGQADVVLAFDTVGSVSALNLDRMSPQRTVVVGDKAERPTSDTVRHVDRTLPRGEVLAQMVGAYSRSSDNVWVEGEPLVERVLRNHVLANSLMLGVACQAGRLPVRSQSIEQAFRLNGVSAEANLSAFRLGRLLQHDPNAVPVETTPVASSTEAELHRYRQRLNGLGGAYDRLVERTGELPESLQRTLAIRLGELILYQDATYASCYLDDVLALCAAEQQVKPGSYELTEAAAKYLYKLMAYKDEYEVARLLLDPGTEQRIRETFIDPRIRYNLHPPLLRTLGRHRKLEMGQWIRPLLKLIARAKRLRGTGFDLFGRTVARRLERELVDWYRMVLADVARHVTEANHKTAVALLRAPDRIRGYEQIKLTSAEQVRAEVTERLERLRTPIKPATTEATDRAADTRDPATE